MNSRRTLLALALAGVVTALLVAGTAFAQTPPTSDRQPKASYHEYFLDRLAGLLGVTRDSLDGALAQARDETADQAVQDGRLTQEQADRIKAREGIGRFSPNFGGPNRGDAGRGVGMLRGQALEVVAEALGMTTQELVAELRSGKTLAELTAGKEDAIRDAVVVAAEARLARAVAAGRITQEQANQMLDQIRNFDLSQLGRLGGGSWPGLRVLPGMREGRDWSGMRDSLQRFRSQRPSGGASGFGVSAL